MPDLSGLKAKLTEKGLKLTKSRQILLEVLLEAPGWVNASEIFKKVEEKDNSSHFSTVCRNLDAMTSKSILCRIDKENNGVYYYTLHDHSLDHHHHLICKSCGMVSALNFCPLNVLSPDELQDFSELECRFEVYGYCKFCRQS